MNTLFVYARHAAPAARRAKSALLLFPQRHAPALALSLPSSRLFGSTAYTRQKPLNVLFFGVDEYDAKYLNALVDEKNSVDTVIKHIELVTIHPKKAANAYGHVVPWEPPVNNIAKSNLIRIHLASTEEEVEQLEFKQYGSGLDINFDVGIVAGYPLKLPPHLVKSFRLGCFSIHNSLLPKYRGPSPVETAILNEDNETGLTLSEYSPIKEDVGKILAQVPLKMPVNPKRTQVLWFLCELGRPMLVMALRNLEFLKQQALDQNESDASYAKEYNEDFCRIIWEKDTAEEIERKSRAFKGKYFIHTNWLGKKMRRRISLEGVGLPNERQDPLDQNIFKSHPGTLFYDGKANYLETLCIDRKRLIINRLRIYLREASGGMKFQKKFLKRSGSMRLLTEPVDESASRPMFVYPPGTEPKHSSDTRN